MHKHKYKTSHVSVGMEFQACTIEGCTKMNIVRFQERRGAIWINGLGQKVVECSGVIEHSK